MRKEHKRGVTTLLSTLIGILLGIIVVAVLAKLGVSIFGVLAISRDDDNSFKDLLLALDRVKADEKQQMIYFVSGKHFLIGFDKDEESIKAGGAAIEKPRTECNNEACICRCNFIDGELSFNSCFEGNCKIIKDASEVKGIVLLDEGLDGIKQPVESLLIIGKNQLPLNIEKKDDSLVFSMPGQPK